MRNDSPSMDNIALITIDSLRADHVGYHGYERDISPTINKYAASGSRFKNAYSHAGHTRASFPGILTGVSPLMYGGYERVSEDQTVVSEVFQEAGFKTGGFHSNLYLSEEFGYGRGWSEFFDSAPDESTISRIRKWAKVNLQDTPLLPILKKGYNFLESSQGLNVGSYHVPADEITDKAINFVRNTTTDRTFLWVHYMDVHHPFLPPEEYQRMFRENTVSDQESIRLRRKLIEEPDAVTDQELETVIDLYDAEIRYTDDQIKRLLNEIERLWNEEYLLAITSDHGDHFLEHGYFGGANGLSVKNHVPLFISGWDDSSEYDELVGLADIPPTLLDAAGLDIPDSYCGSNLQRLVFRDEWDRDTIKGGWNSADEYAYRIRDQRWKLIVHPEDDDELYDLDSDPNERQNVLEEYPRQEKHLRELLREHRERLNATETEVQRPDVDEEVKQRLRRLGYDE